MYKPYRTGGVDSPEFPNNADQMRAQLRGDAFGQFAPQQQLWERCTIHDTYPDRHTCDVATDRGRFLSGVPWPNTGGGVVAPQRGDRMAITFSLGEPALLPMSVDVQRAPEAGDSYRATAVTGVGGEDQMYSDAGSGNSRGRKPADVLSGDWLQVGDMGNMMGVLAGGTMLVKASDLAQIIATQARNLLRLVGQNFELYTGAGALEFNTKEGKTSMVLRAGGDSETESSPSAENFRIRCELGDEGEMVDFRVTDGKGRSLYRLHVDPDGRVEQEALRKTEVLEQDRRTEIGSDDNLTVGRDRSMTVGGNVTETVGGSQRTQVSGSLRQQALGDASLQSGHDLFLHSSRNTVVTATGALTGGDPAVAFDVANGDVAFRIGSPLSGDTQVRRSGFTVDAFSGDIKMESTIGIIELNAPLRHVKVGGAAGIAPFTAVLYEFLQDFFELFGNLIDTHTHTHPLLGGTPTTPPLPLPYLASRPFLPLASSRKVKLGG